MAVKRGMDKLTKLGDLPELRQRAIRNAQTTPYKGIGKPWRDVACLQSLTRLEFRLLRVCCPECEATRKGCECCNGTGLVCPTCTGSQWLAMRQEGDVSIRVRCHDCGVDMSDGWEADVDKKYAAIERWLYEWQSGEHPYVPKPAVVNPVGGLPPAPPITPDEDALIRASLRQSEPADDEPPYSNEDFDDLPF